MKILLTGKVKSGKTTMLTTLLATIDDKRGMDAIALLEGDERVAFRLRDDTGRPATLARTDTKTDTPVGRFFVDLPSLDTFIEPLFDFEPGQLLYIDEIGHMQLCSEEFQKLVRAYLDAPNDYLGTISSIYEHPFINEVTSRSDILLCTVTPDNRNAMRIALNAALQHRATFDDLPVALQAKVLSLARGYLETESYTSLKKLFSNALTYVAEDRVQATVQTTFVIRGNHGEHYVHVTGNTYVCDCDFFNGRGQFAGNAGECSHIQAIKILE